MDVVEFLCFSQSKLRKMRRHAGSLFCSMITLHCWRPYTKSHRERTYHLLGVIVRKLVQRHLEALSYLKQSLLLSLIHPKFVHRIRLLCGLVPFSQGSSCRTSRITLGRAHFVADFL